MRLLSVKVENPENETVYPYSSELFRKGFTIAFAPITIIVGENGVGKSTLLESLAFSVGFPTYGGDADCSIMFNELNRVISFNSHRQEITLAEKFGETPDEEVQVDDNKLAENMKLVWRVKSKKGFFLRAETFAMLINHPLFNVGGVSHGEGIIDVVKKIKKEGLYILDEPESGLSPSKIMELMVLMHDKVQTCGAQFIISTHNPLLMCMPNSKLLEMTKTSIKKILPEQTNHFIITKRFLDKKEDIMSELFR